MGGALLQVTPIYIPQLKFSQSCIESFLRKQIFLSCRLQLPQAFLGSRSLIQQVGSPVRVCLGTWDTGWDFRVAAVNPPSSPTPSPLPPNNWSPCPYDIYVPHSSIVSSLKFQWDHHNVLFKNVPIPFSLDNNNFKNPYFLSCPLASQDSPCLLLRIMPQLSLPCSLHISDKSFVLDLEQS